MIPSKDAVLAMTEPGISQTSLHGFITYSAMLDLTHP
jgi:hypothetical protein